MLFLKFKLRSILVLFTLLICHIVFSIGCDDKTPTETEIETEMIPLEPTDLTADVHGNEIYLTWKDNSNNEDGFIIFEGVDVEEFDRVESNINEYVMSGLDANTLYIIAVCAYNEYGLSDGPGISVKTESIADTFYAIKDATLQHHRNVTTWSDGVWYFENEQDKNRIGGDALSFNSGYRETYYSTAIYFGDLQTQIGFSNSGIKDAYIEFYCNRYPVENLNLWIGELCDDSWSENNITTSNCPGLYATSIFDFIMNEQNSICRVPMTESIQLIINKFRPHGGFVIYAKFQYGTLGDRFYEFSTREDIDLTKRPKLIVEFE